MTLNQLTASKIKEIRSKYGYSAEKVATELGITKGNYSQMENGKVEITMNRLDALSRVFKLPIEAFVPNSKTQNIQVTNGENSPNIVAQTYNHTDPNVTQAITQAIVLLNKTLEKLG